LSRKTPSTPHGEREGRAKKKPPEGGLELRPPEGGAISCSSTCVDQNM
jgi:hypothetical protein